MKTRDRQTLLESGINNSIKNNFKIILFGIIILMASICPSCNPDDDETDGTSGATSQVFTHQEFKNPIKELPILIG